MQGVETVERKHQIYIIEFDDGAVYVGATKMDIKDRMRHHHRVARQGTRSHHPLYARLASENSQYEVKVLMQGLTKPEAQDAEVACIAAMPAESTLNQSRGGRFDAVDGAARLQTLMQNPEWAAEQNRKVSEGLRASAAYNSHAVQDVLAKALAKWREENPKQTYLNAIRASRIAANKARKKSGKPRTEPAPNKMQSIRRRKKAVAKVWAGRTPEQKAEIARKISESMKRHHARKTEEERTASNEQLAQARQSIDHDVRRQRQAEYFETERRKKETAQ